VGSSAVRESSVNRARWAPVARPAKKRTYMQDLVGSWLCEGVRAAVLYGVCGRGRGLVITV